MPDLTLKETQQRVDDWINTIGVRYFSELTNLAQLVEEVGELARVISRTYGEQSHKVSDEGREIDDELADVPETNGFVLPALSSVSSLPK